jgi:flagellar protein FlaF
MYQISYAEHHDDAPRECRAREREAFDLAIELLQRAEQDGASPSGSIQALHFLCRLWRALIEDLAAPDNDLPEVLKADLVSIGIWMLKEAESIRVGRSRNFRGLIEICSIVRDGLR